MLECNTCNKILQYSKFAKANNTTRGYQTTCKDCCKFLRNKKKEKVTKKAAEDFMRSLQAEGVVYTCKCCSLEQHVENFYYKRDSGKVYVNSTACRQCTKDKQRLRSFGISPKQYNDMLEEQANKCLICDIDHKEYQRLSQNGKVFAIDHCHVTGKIRGLLCDKCNRGLGYFKDDLTLLAKAITYLKGDDIV